MGLPTPTRTYSATSLVNQSITYVSLNDLVASLGYGVKNHLVATVGMTVKYTCDGTTGPSSASDHTDRLSSKANFTTRGANATSAQSFWVLTDANGSDWMFTYQGATDDIARISFSKAGLFTPAGTANQQPTATDEEVMTSAQSVVGSTTSGNRVWNCIASSDKKAAYVFVFRSNVLVGQAWHIGSATSAIAGVGNSYSPTIIGLSSSTFAPATYFNGSLVIGRARPTIASSDVSTALLAGFECVPTTNFLDGINCEAQGSLGSLIYPLSGWSNTTGAKGKICNFIDVYRDSNSQADGNTTTDKNWIHLVFSASAAAGVLWPWDGSSVPQTA